MYNYKFESIDFEEQYAFELKHERKFTSEELDEMVIKAIKEYVENEYDNYLLFPCNLISEICFSMEVFRMYWSDCSALKGLTMKAGLNMVGKPCSVMISATGMEKTSRKY